MAGAACDKRHVEMNKPLIKFLGALAVVAAANPAAAVVLDITSAGPSPTFGDTSTVNFTWDAGMAYSPGYSGQDAFYCEPLGITPCVFSIAPAGAATDVILNSFTFGSYAATTSVLWSVMDLATSLVVASGSAALTNNTFATIDINLPSTLGFAVSFGPDSYAAGLNSVTYNNAVPTPGSLALLGAALFGFAATRRRA
jgi:hypothetical protein